MESHFADRKGLAFKIYSDSTYWSVSRELLEQSVVVYIAVATVFLQVILSSHSITSCILIDSWMKGIWFTFGSFTLAAAKVCCLLQCFRSVCFCTEWGLVSRFRSIFLFFLVEPGQKRETVEVAPCRSTVDS